jgi:hypothetical protein
VASRSKTSRAKLASRKTSRNLRGRVGKARPAGKRNGTGRVLDSLAREAIDRCAGLLACCGYSPDQSSRRFQQRCERVSAQVVGRPADITKQFDLSGHVLTLWSEESAYLLPDGRFRPIPEKGPAPSLEALVRKVGRGLTLKTARATLFSTGSLRRHGRMYVPCNSWQSHPSNSPSQQAHHMRVLVEFLRTLEHNSRMRRTEDRWYQFAAANTAIPVSQFAAVSRYVRSTGHAFLRDKDAFLYRLARKRKKSEPTVPVSIGLYLSQTRPFGGSTRGGPRKTE